MRPVVGSPGALNEVRVQGQPVIGVGRA